MNAPAASASAPLTSFDALLRLPYFDLLACLGQRSLHPGGLDSTALLLSHAELHQGDAVLEVGCGTGVTTHALMLLGFDVSVAEPNPRLLRAAASACERGLGRSPREYLTTAEELTGIRRASIDLALFEAVFGFFSDRERAIQQALRVLKRVQGRVAITDFHYVSEPPVDLQRRVAEVVGQEIEVCTESDWRELLAGFRPMLWETADSQALPPLSLDSLRTGLAESTIVQLDQVSERDLDRVAQKLEGQRAVFEENRRYLRIHQIVARVPYG